MATTVGIVHLSENDGYRHSRAVASLRDEHEDTITTGNFEVAPGPFWPNTWWLGLPASRHGAAGTFSFADGHAEIKKWRDPRTLVPVKRLVGWYDIHSPQNRDVLWVTERASSKKPDAPPDVP